MAMQDSVLSRAEKAANILSVQVSDLLKILEDAGIENTPIGIELLDSPSTTIKDIVGILMRNKRKEDGGEFDVEYPLGKNILEIPAKAAAYFLKNCSKTEDPKLESSSVSDITIMAQGLRPVQQWDDKSLLENFIATRSIESEEELDRRAKHQKFVVLKDPSMKNVKKYEPGQEVIDVDLTLKLLRDTRKHTVPSILPVEGGVVVVYRITELNPQDRIVELCPICGEILYEGYCSKCEISFSNVGDDERAYVRLVVNSEKFNIKSHSDRKAVHASASKGLDDLKSTWPSISPVFEDLKATSGLPQLRMIKNMPVKVADPFFHDGNRAFGNRKF